MAQAVNLERNRFNTPFIHTMHSNTSLALALSRPVQSEVQEELLAHVSGELVNRVVILPLLFRLSVVFSSKSRGSQEGQRYGI